MAHVGIKRLAAGNTEDHGSQGHKAVGMIDGEIVDHVIGVQGCQYRRLLEDGQ